MENAAECERQPPIECTIDIAVILESIEHSQYCWKKNIRFTAIDKVQRYSAQQNIRNCLNIYWCSIAKLACLLSCWAHAELNVYCGKIWMNLKMFGNLLVHQRIAKPIWMGSDKFCRLLTIRSWVKLYNTNCLSAVMRIANSITLVFMTYLHKKNNLHRGS